MFSRTTIASSISRPIASDNAISVSVFSVIPRKYMMMNDEITEMGSVSPVITVERQEFRKQEDDEHGQQRAEHQRVLDVGDRLADEVRRVAHDLDLGAGRQLRLAAARPPSRTASTTPTVFAFVCLVMSIATAGSPAMSASERCSSTVSSTVATSDRRIGSSPRRAITMLA